MTDYKLGSSGGDFSDLTRRAQEASASIDELNQKEQQRRATEERTVGVERESKGLRSDLAATTGELASALQASTSAFRAEIEAVNASNTALARNLELRRQLVNEPMAGVGGVSRGGGASRGGSAALLGVQEDPHARARLSAAYSSQAAAETQQKAAAAAYGASLKSGSNVAPEQAALLLQQREQASAQVQAARQETKAAQASVTAQEALAAEQQAARAVQSETNAALRTQRQADERAAGEAQAAAGARAELAARLRLAVNLAGQGVTPISSATRGFLATETGLSGAPGAGSQLLRRAGYGQGFFGITQPGYPVSEGHLPSGVPWLGTTTGGASEPIATQSEALTAHRALVVQNATAVESLGAAQGRTNAQFQAAGALYADSSNALSRHGALTTEFIQSFARGDVTLREFSSQMVSTIGKFGGWVAAGAAVYGVFNAFKDLTEGATQTQAAVQQLGRFIPGLGGPAGGGTSQIPAAQESVRNISTEFNVPIRDVVDSMTVMARTFHNVTDAGNATRAVLAVSRLDQIAPQQAEQYLPAIARSFGLTRGSELVGVVNSLNTLQSSYGARVSQTLPALARAGPAALAAGVDLHQLEALTALGVRSGQTGPQVGTALIRSLTRFAFLPSSEVTLGKYGINAQAGEGGDLYKQVLDTIYRRVREGNPLNGRALTEIGTALGGPQLGGRSITPLLVQQAQAASRGQNLYGELNRGAASPRPYQEDLARVLGTVSEQFKSIGIALQNFGGALAQAGALTPIIGALDVIKVVVHAFETLASPIARVAGLFNDLPGFLKDAIGVLAGFAALRAFSRTGYGTAAQSFAGRLVGSDWLSDSANQRAAIQQQLARTRNVLLPDQLTEQRTANSGYYQALAQQDLASKRLEETKARGEKVLPGEFTKEGTPLTLATLPGTDARAGAYQEELATGIAKEEATVAATNAAQQRVLDATLLTAQLQEDVRVFTGKEFDIKQRTAYMYGRGQVAVEEETTAQQQAANAARANTDAILNQTRTITRASEGTLAASRAASEAPLAAGVAGAAGAAGVAVAGLAARGTVGERLAAQPTESEAAALTGGRSFQAVRSASRLLAGPGGSIGGLLLAQQFGSQSLQNAFGDMLGAQLIRPGNLALGAAGFGLGLATSPAGGVLGTAQHVAGGALFGGFIGKAAAPLVEKGVASGLTSLTAGLFGDVVAPELAVPLQILGALGGGALGGLFGSAPAPPPDLNSAGFQHQTAQDVNKALQSGNLGAFQSWLGKNVLTANLGSGASSARAQQTVTGVAQSLTASLQLYGAQSQEGKFDSKALSSLIGAAIPFAKDNPILAQQLSQTALQAKTQETTRELQYRIATTTGSTQGAAAAAEAQSRSTFAPAQSAFGEAKKELNGAQRIAGEDAQSILRDLRRSDEAAAKAKADQAARAQGGIDPSVTAGTVEADQRQAIASKATLTAAEGRLRGQEGQVKTAQEDVQTARAINRVAHESATLQEQIAAQTALDAELQTDQAATALKVAKAGANTQAALDLQIQGAKQQLADIQNSHIGQRDKQQKSDALNTQILGFQQQKVQDQFSLVQAQGQLAVASVSPGASPVAAAQAASGAAAAAYQFALAHSKGKNPAFNQAQVVQFDAQAVAAANAVVTATADFQQTMNDIATQIQQAHDYGDPIKQAQDAIQGALKDLASALTPQQHAQAQLSLANAYLQQHQAYLSNIQAQGQLQIALNQGDSVAAAEANIKLAQAMLAHARGTTEQLQGQTALASANYQYAQAVEQRIALQGQVAESAAQGAPIQQAQIAIATAQQMLGAAKGIDQQLQAQAALNNAQFQYVQALVQYQVSLGDLAASTTTNPLQRLRDQIKGAANALGTARGNGSSPAVITQLQTNLNNLRDQFRTSWIDTRESTVQFQLSMMQISAQQALNMLQDLLKAKGITLQQRQAIDQEIRSIELGQYSTIGGGPGSFDLVPGGGNIRTPTVYDVRRAMRHLDRGQPGISGEGGGPGGREGLRHASGHTSATQADTTATHAHAQAVTLGAAALQIHTTATHEDTRAMRAHAAALHANVTGGGHVKSVSVQVFVRNSNDVPKVADALDRVTGGHLRARLRAAGLRGV